MKQFLGLFVLIFVEAAIADEWWDCCGVGTVNPVNYSGCQPNSPNWRRDIDVVISEIIGQHNECRNETHAVNMQNMAWDPKLACVAKVYSRQCSEDHDTYEQRAYSERYQIGVGQNLAVGWGGYTFQDMISGWCNERYHWVYGAGKTDPNSPEPVGHYTQMVWASTISVGCGASICEVNGEEMEVFICNYGPAGNVNDPNVPFATAAPP